MYLLSAAEKGSKLQRRRQGGEERRMAGAEAMQQQRLQRLSTRWGAGLETRARQACSRGRRPAPRHGTHRKASPGVYSGFFTTSSTNMAA